LTLHYRQRCFGGFQPALGDCARIFLADIAHTDRVLSGADYPCLGSDHSGIRSFYRGFRRAYCPLRCFIIGLYSLHRQLIAFDIDLEQFLAR